MRSGRKYRTVKEIKFIWRGETSDGAKGHTHLHRLTTLTVTLVYIQTSNTGINKQ